MSMHLVVGAGPVGTAITSQLVSAGHEVVLASRSGRGANVAGATRVAVDATDARALNALAKGSAVIYNALNPKDYHRWAADWPPMWQGLMTAAAGSGAVLATVGNLYGYGRPEGAMRETQPLRPVESKGRVRVVMWEEALRAHREGRFPALEVRGSDYLGAGAMTSVTLSLAAVVTGKTVRVVGSPDAPHSWTYTGDVARLIVAAAADPGAHGRAWHVPTNPPVTQRVLLQQAAGAAGRALPKISPIPTWMLRAIGLVQRPVSAVADVAYQYTAPFVIDDSAARSRFGLNPTPWNDIIMETVHDLQQQAAGRQPRVPHASTPTADGAR